MSAFSKLVCTTGLQQLTDCKAVQHGACRFMRNFFFVKRRRNKSHISDVMELNVPSLQLAGHRCCCVYTSRKPRFEKQNKKKNIYAHYINIYIYSTVLVYMYKASETRLPEPSGRDTAREGPATELLQSTHSA